VSGTATGGALSRNGRLQRSGDRESQRSGWGQTRSDGSDEAAGATSRWGQRSVDGKLRVFAYGKLPFTDLRDALFRPVPCS
jgi:hypothetical protein